jgi:predicted Zn-dependent protease
MYLTARTILALGLGLFLQACIPVANAPLPAPRPAPLPVSAPSGSVLPVETAARNFVEVVRRVEPVAENYCRALRQATDCDFQIVIDDRPGQPPNAFQTVDENGRPLLGFTLALIADARNRDELAFVLGHEAAHHIAGHLPRQRDTALAGAILAGVLAQAGGAGEQAVSAAQEFGATLGARQYSKDFELEADSLGAEIAYVAGFDPVLGAAFFARLPDPGDRFLGTHPANAQRQSTVAATVARLKGL